jgi:hypothetical protein
MIYKGVAQMDKIDTMAAIIFNSYILKHYDYKQIQSRIIDKIIPKSSKWEMTLYDDTRNDSLVIRYKNNVVIIIKDDSIEIRQLTIPDPKQQKQPTADIDNILEICQSISNINIYETLTGQKNEADNVINSIGITYDFFYETEDAFSIINNNLPKNINDETLTKSGLFLLYKIDEKFLETIDGEKIDSKYYDAVIIQANSDKVKLLIKQNEVRNILSFNCVYKREYNMDIVSWINGTTRNYQLGSWHDFTTKVNNYFEQLYSKSISVADMVIKNGNQ